MPAPVLTVPPSPTGRYRTVIVTGTYYNGPQDSNHQYSEASQVPILSQSALIAKRKPPASYPASQDGLEPLDAYTPAVKGTKRYGGLTAGGNGLWDCLLWRTYMLWGTGTECGQNNRPTNDPTAMFHDSAGTVYQGWANADASVPVGDPIYASYGDEIVRGLTNKEIGFYDGDALKGTSWLQKNEEVPAIVLGIAGGIASAAGAAAAGAADAGAGAADAGAEAGSGVIVDGTVPSAVAPSAASGIISQAGNIALKSAIGLAVSAGVGAISKAVDKKHTPTSDPTNTPASGTVPLHPTTVSIFGIGLLAILAIIVVTSD